MADEPSGPAANRVVDAHKQASEDVGGDVHGEKNFTEDRTRLQVERCLASLSTSTLSSKDAGSELSADPCPISRENAEGCAQEPVPTADQCEERDVNKDAPSGDGTCVTGDHRSRDQVQRKKEMRKEKGDEDERSSKIGDALKLESDLDPMSLGGWGEKIRPGVIMAFPMYEARTRLDAEDEDEVVRRFAIFSEERCSREALSRRGGKRKDPPCDEMKVPRSRSRYKQPPLDEDDEMKAPRSRSRFKQPPLNEDDEMKAPRSRSWFKQSPLNEDDEMKAPRSRSRCKQPPLNEDDEMKAPRSRSRCKQPPLNEDDEMKVPRSRSRYKQPPLDEDDEMKAPRSRSRYRQPSLDEDDDTQRALGKRWRGTVRGSPERESPDITLVHNVVDNLIEEFEASPILKKPLPRPSSSPRRGNWSPRRKTSPARTRSSPVRSLKRSPPRSPGAVSRLKSHVSTVIRRRPSSDEPDEKELERVWTVCSLLESITGDVTTEARRVYEPRGDNFQAKNKPLSGDTDPDRINEYEFQNYAAKKGKQSSRRNRARSNNREKAKAEKARWKSSEKKTCSNSGARARRRSTSRKEEEPERDKRPERRERRYKARRRSGPKSRREEELEDEEEHQVVKERGKTRGRSRRTSRRETEFESESELDIVAEKDTGKYRGDSRQQFISEAELGSDDVQPRRDRSKRIEWVEAVIDERDTDGETSATEISVEDLIETHEAASATEKTRVKTLKKGKDRKVRFFTNLLFHRRPSQIAESSLTEPHEVPEKRPGKIFWREHDAAVVRASSDGTDAGIQSSQEGSCSTKQGMTSLSSSGKLFLTIEPRCNLGRTQDDTEDGRYSKLSKVQGITIEIDPNVLDDDESPRQPKESYYCEVQEPSPKNERQVKNAENEILLIDRSGSSGLVMRSLSSPDSDGIELKTDVRQTCPSSEDIYQPLAVDDEQPIFRARIGRRRSAMPPDEPAEDEEDVRVFTTRIGRRSNVSATSSVTRAASVVGTESDRRNLRHVLSDDISITPAARRPSSQSLSIELELPREWSVEPCRAESAGAILRRPYRQRRSHWPRSRSRSPHRRPRYGRPLCYFRPSSRMSRTLQLIRGSTLPSCQYMCAQPPITQVYTSLPPAPPPSMVPPPCMEPNIRLEHRRHRRAPPLWAFRPQPPPHEKEMIITEEIPQTSPAPMMAASKVTTNTSFATAIDSEFPQQQQPEQQEQQKTFVIYHGTTVEGPSTQFNVPTETVPPEKTAVIGQPDEALVCVTATPATSARRSDSTPCPQLSTSTEIRPSSTVQSVDVVQYAESSQRNDSSSSDTHVTTVWESRFLDNWEQEKPPPEVKPVDLMIPRESRFYGNLVKNLPQRGPSMLYIILLVGILAGMAAVFSTYARRHAQRGITEIDSDTEGQQPWMFGPLVSGDPAKRVLCLDPSCITQFVQLSRSLDSTVNPCQNFYGHVCSVRQANGTVDEQMTKHIESRVVGFFKGIGSPDRDLPVASASRRLWKDCVDLATLNKLGRVPLQALLNLSGLSSWPYAYATQSGQVWRSAGRLQRLMGLAPLVGLVALPDGSIQLIPGDQGSLEADDVLDSMLAMRRNNSRLRDLAADVADLGRRLSGLRERNAPSDSVDVQPPRLFLDAALEGLQKPSAVHVAEAGLLRQYVLLVNKSSSRSVLNLLGYRLIRHVDLFTPAIVKSDLNSGVSARRETACVRLLLEHALTADAAEYVRYASLRGYLDFDFVRSTAAELKRVLLAKLPGLRWMDGGTRKSAQTRLRELKVRFFFDRYEGTNESAQARWPTALPSQALATYQRFREARFQSQLSQGDDTLGVQQQCAYDAGYKVLFVGLSVVDVREPGSPTWPAFQAARLGPRLARCLLQVLLQQAHWSDAARTRLDALRSHGCGDAVVDRGALEPAKEVFDTHVRRLGQGVTSTPSWDKMFYLVHASSMCEDPDRQRRSLQHNGPHWERVNRPLATDPIFQKTFKCEAQNSKRACSFWEA